MITGICQDWALRLLIPAPAKKVRHDFIKAGIQNAESLLFLIHLLQYYSLAPGKPPLFLDLAFLHAPDK